MKLYTYDPAPNPRRVNLFLQHKGIELETQQIDMMSAEQLGDEYKQINPLGTLPALKLDNGTLLTEVVGICTYLEGLYPQKPLMGTLSLEKAQIISWDHRVFVEGFMSVAEALRNRSKAFANRALPGPLDIEQIPELVARGNLKLVSFFNALNDHLVNRDYMVGEGISLADIDVVILVEFSAWVKQSIPHNCEDLQRYYDNIASKLG